MAHKTQKSAVKKRDTPLRHIPLISHKYFIWIQWSYQLFISVSTSASSIELCTYPWFLYHINVNFFQLIVFYLFSSTLSWINFFCILWGISFFVCLLQTFQYLFLAYSLFYFIYLFICLFCVRWSSVSRYFLSVFLTVPVLFNVLFDTFKINNFFS